MLTALSLLFCTGCTQFELSAENLMRPPALTTEQLNISTALEAAIGDSDIKYKYPETGDHRSSFLFYDLDRDGEEEALVFYQAASKGSSTWMNILDRKNGEWVSVFDLSSPNQETEVDFISFEPILENGSITIGWADDYRNGKCAVVYRYDGSVLYEVLEEDYDFVHFADLNQNGTLDLFTVLSDPFYGECTVSMFSESSSITGSTILERKSTLELPYDSAEIISVQEGYCDSVTPALFIDSLINISRNETQMVTQVVTAYGNDLVNLLDAENTDTELSKNTLRPTFTLCQDIDGDGIMEVPSVLPLPGYEEQEEQLYLTTYSRLGVGRTWQTVFRCVINEDHRYLLQFPERWVGAVTILSQPESNEWSFVRYNNSLEDSSSLLLRIKVYSVKDYHDRFERDELSLLGKQGLFEYYAYLPEDNGEAVSVENPGESAEYSNLSLAIDALELDELFRFLD